MENFNFYMPTKVVFGRGAEHQVGRLIREQGCKKALVHHSNSSEKSGLLECIVKSLEEQGISYVRLGGVVANPRLALVYEGIELCKKEGVDFVLAVGGGSAIDSAKAIGYGAANEGDVWDFYDYKREAQACLPIGAVVTIAAAGSETSNSSVITKEEGLLKRAYDSDLCRPRFAVMNPQLTMSLSAYQTACGCVDIMMHTMERYFNQCENMELNDSISEALMRTVVKYAKILAAEPDNYNARAEIMWAGSLAHNGLTGCGTGGGDWMTHKLQMELSAMFGVAHGAGIAALWASWARYVLKGRPGRFAQFATNVMGVQPAASEEETAQKGIMAVEDFYREIKMPVSITELVGSEPTDAQIEEMAEKCSVSSGGCGGAILPLKKEDMAAIYRAAK